MLLCRQGSLSSVMQYYVIQSGMHPDNEVISQELSDDIQFINYDNHLLLTQDSIVNFHRNL